MLKVGDKAPDFALKNVDGEVVSLKDFRGKKVLIYIYPKDNTPGCTAQACSYRDNFEVFSKKDIVVIGISKDSIRSHTNFKNKYELPFILLSDEDNSVIDAYGSWQLKKLYGKEYMGIVRSTFLIDENGNVEFVNYKVKAKEDADYMVKNFV